MVAASRMTHLGVRRSLGAIVLFLLLHLSRVAYCQSTSVIDAISTVEDLPNVNDAVLESVAFVDEEDDDIDSHDATDSNNDIHILRNKISMEALPYMPPPNDFPPDRWGNRIPDFSQVGYRRGHVPLPEISVAITLQPSSDPRINDRARIQNAIDWVGLQPLRTVTLRDGKTEIQSRGAVLLQAGIYRIQGALILNKSGVVLRGEGNGPDGTVLMATGQFKHDFIFMNGLLDSSFQGSPEYLERYGSGKAMYPKDPYVVQDRHVTSVANEYVPVGTTRVPVQDTSNFGIGAEVVLEFKPKASWTRLLGTDHISPRPGNPSRTLNWDPQQYTLRYVRKIMAIEDGPQVSRASKTQVLGSHKIKEHTIKKGRRHGEKSPHKGRYSSSDMRLQVHTNETQATWEGGSLVLDTELTPESQLNAFSGPLEAVVALDSGDDDGEDATWNEDDDDDDEDDQEDEDGISGEKRKIDVRKIPGVLTLDIPTVMNMDPYYGRSVIYNFERETSIPSDVGVENLALWSEYDPDNMSDERHGWFAVMIDHCEHCWVADIKATNFVSGIKAGPGSKHVTIQDCEIIEPVSLRSEGGRRYMYMLQGQMGLVKRCFATDARHDFMTGSKTAGPNVFVDSDGIRANNDAGPHDRWATGILYDNIHSHDFNVRNRGWMGSGQGWAGAFHVAYRCSADVPVEFQSPPGATNWVIDFQGNLGRKSVDFDGDDATFLDPANASEIPRSLYWSQLVARMGGEPTAAATMLEDYVGVAGKNKYPTTLPKKFTTPDEILASEQTIMTVLASRDRQDHSKSTSEHGDLRWETDVTSTTDIQQELSRLELPDDIK